MRIAAVLVLLILAMLAAGAPVVTAGHAPDELHTSAQYLAVN
jgi:hypothetical protein